MFIVLSVVSISPLTLCSIDSAEDTNIKRLPFESKAIDDESVVRGVTRATPLNGDAVVPNATPAKCATDPLFASARTVFVFKTRKKTVPVVF